MYKDRSRSNMRAKCNTRSLEPSSPSTKSKNSPKSATGKQRRKSIKPKSSWTHQSLSHDSVTSPRSPYLSRHNFDFPVVSKFTETSKSPKVNMKINRNSHKKRKIWTLPPTTVLPPASLNRHEGSEQCDDSKTYYRGRTAIGDRPSDSERDKTFVIEGRTEKDKRHGASECKNGAAQKANESKELMQLLTGSNPRQNPAYIISGTLTPERQLSSNDVLRLFGELTNRQIMERHDSMESIMYDRKYEKPSHKHHKRRNNRRVSTTLSRRTEHITYNLTPYLYKKNGIKNCNISNTSSEHLTYVPPVELYEQPFGVVLRKKKDYFDRNIDKGTVVFKHNGKNSNSFEDSKRVLRDNSFMKETTHQTNNEKGPPLPRKGIPIVNGVSIKARNALNAVSKLVKINTRNEENPAKYQPITAPSRIQKKSGTHKLTLADIKKKLALLNFPVTVTGKDQCAPVKVQDYVAPQYETMPKIWQYMKGWSTDYNQDNAMPNKYLKLLQRQKCASKRRRSQIKIDHEKSQRNSQRPGQRKFYYSTNKAKHETNNANLEENDLKILFQSHQNGTLDTINNVLLNTSSPLKKSDQIFSTPICEKELFSEEKNIIDVFMEHLKNYKVKDISNGVSDKKIIKPVKYSTLTKSHDNAQNKIESTLEKLESNYFYDYNKWIKNSPTMSRKSPLVKRKKAFISPEPLDIKASPQKKMEPNSIKEYSSPTKIIKSFVKSRRRIHKRFKSPPCTYKRDLNMAVKLADENISTPKLSQSEKSIKPVITVPGFSERPNKIIVKSLNGNEITIEDSFKKILMRFETAMSREEFILLHEPPKSIDDNFSVSLLNAGQTKHFRSKYQLCTVRLPEQVCSLWALFIKKLESGSCDIKTEFPKNAIDASVNNLMAGFNLPKGRLHCHLNSILGSQNHWTKSKDLNCFSSDIDKLLSKVSVISFLEGYTPIERNLAVKINKPLLKTNILSTLKIHFSLLTENQKIAFRFGQYYVNDEFIYLNSIKYSACSKNTKNSLIRLHQENMAILTFSISVKVIHNIIKLMSSGYVDLMFSMADLKTEIDKVQRIDNTTEMKRPQALRKTVSATGIKNEMLLKINRWKNKSTSDIYEGYKRKLRPDKIKFIKEECSERRHAKFKVNKVNGIRDFMMIIGCAGGDASANTVDGELSEKILELLREFTIWSEEISQGQALLILLLSSKSQTRSLKKFRSALVHGIATKRISSSTELDQEYLAVEQDADVDYMADDGIIVEELYAIARKAALENNRPQSAKSIENAIDSLVNRKRKLNLSYLRVMAKYVGLGLVTASVK